MAISSASRAVSLVVVVVSGLGVIQMRLVSFTLAVSLVLVALAVPAVAAVGGDMQSYSVASDDAGVLGAIAVGAIAVAGFALGIGAGSGYPLLLNHGSANNSVTLSTTETDVEFEDIVPVKRGWLERIEIRQQFSFVFATASPTEIDEGVLRWLSFDLDVHFGDLYGGEVVKLHRHVNLATLRAQCEAYGYPWEVSVAGFSGASGTGVYTLRMVIPFDLLISAANVNQLGRKPLGWIYMPFVEKINARFTHKGYRSSELFSADAANVSSMTSTFNVFSVQHSELPRPLQAGLRMRSPKLFQSGVVNRTGIPGMRGAYIAAHITNMELLAFETKIMDSDLDASDDTGDVTATENRTYDVVWFSVYDASSAYADGGLTQQAEAILVKDSANTEIAKVSELDVIHDNRQRHLLTAAGGTGRARLAGHHEIRLDRDESGFGRIKTSSGRKLITKVTSNSSLTANSSVGQMFGYVHNPARRAMVDDGGSKAGKAE